MNLIVARLKKSKDDNCFLNLTENILKYLKNIGSQGFLGPVMIVTDNAFFQPGYD